MAQCEAVNSVTTSFNTTSACDLAVQKDGSACVLAILNWRCTSVCGECGDQPCESVCASVTTLCSNANKTPNCLSFLTCSNATTCSPLIAHATNGLNTASISIDEPSLTETISTVHNTSYRLIPSIVLLFSVGYFYFS